MKGHQKTSSSTYRTGSGSTWNTPKAAPREQVPRPDREESSSFKRPVPPRPKAGFDEFRSSDSYQTRNPSNPAPPPPTPKRNGFMPSNPGADEPSAGKGNYSTSRVNRNMPPPPPPREAPSFEQEHEQEREHRYTPATAPPVNHNTRPSTKMNDPLRQFRAEEEPSFEPRISTPYANAGGEKFDPFDAVNLERSKSTREPFNETPAKKPVPRAGSDPNLASPRPNGTSKNDTPKKTAHAFASSPDSSDSENGPEINPQKPRTFAKPRKPTQAQDQRQSDTTTTETQDQTKRFSFRDFQNGMKDNSDGKQSPIVDPSAGGPPAQEEPKRQPSMYEKKSSKYTASDPKEPPHNVKNPSFSGTPLRQPLFQFKSMQHTYTEKCPGSFTKLREDPAVSPPSGGSSPSSKGLDHGLKDKLHPNGDASTQKLNSFEAAHHNLLDQLLVNKAERAKSFRQNDHVKPVKSANHQVHNDKAIYSFKSIPAETSIPIKRPSFPTKSQPVLSVGDSRLNSVLLEKLNAHANISSKNSFSMKLDGETFSPTRPKINTTFSSEEWHGKFEAGGDYFVPEQKASQIPLHARNRAMSGSRPRGRSPVKSRSADSKAFPASKPFSDTPIESPGGARFSAQDWAETFKPQTFAPPSIPSPTKSSGPPRNGTRKPRVPIAKPTVGTAAVVIEDDSSDDKPLFTGRNMKAAKPPASPDAMDVDSPPPATPAPPAQAPPPQAPPTQAPHPRPSSSGLKINTEPLKRAAAPSQSPVDTEGLGVEFHDMNIQDLLSSLHLPTPPTAPKYSHESNPELSHGIYLSSFTSYMGDWDVFAKRMLLHLLARKNQNDGLGANRWEKSQGLDIYRRGLKEDGAVMSHWVAAMASHDQAMKEFAIQKERFDIAEGRDRERPRKKAH